MKSGAGSGRLGQLRPGELLPPSCGLRATPTGFRVMASLAAAAPAFQALCDLPRNEGIAYRSHVPPTILGVDHIDGRGPDRGQAPRGSDVPAHPRDRVLRYWRRGHSSPLSPPVVSERSALRCSSRRCRRSMLHLGRASQAVEQRTAYGHRIIVSGRVKPRADSEQIATAQTPHRPNCEVGVGKPGCRAILVARDRRRHRVIVMDQSPSGLTSNHGLGAPP
jgi:hypothetical protein